MNPASTLFRKACCAPACPACAGAASLQHFQLPLYGHFCESRSMNTYWTSHRPGLVFLSLGALLDLLTGGGDEAA